jgi:hypothetical protein
MPKATDYYGRAIHIGDTVTAMGWGGGLPLGWTSTPLVVLRVNRTRVIVKNPSYNDTRAVPAAYVKIVMRDALPVAPTDLCGVKP